MKLKKWLIGLLIVIVGGMLYGVGWFMEAYGPDQMAIEALLGNERVVVTQTKDCIIFTPINGDEGQPGLLYYQGAKVEAEAYAVMGLKIAERGIPVVISKMPVNFAIFDVDKAVALKDELGLSDNWAIGGHSLGGAMASKLVYDQPGVFKSLILFASYPAGKSNDLSMSGLKVLSISASRDALATREKVEARVPFLPIDTTYVIIEGGNHSQFGNYGFQKGDHPATLSAEEQMDQIVEAVVAHLKP